MGSLGIPFSGDEKPRFIEAHDKVHDFGVPRPHIWQISIPDLLLLFLPLLLDVVATSVGEWLDIGYRTEQS